MSRAYTFPFDLSPALAGRGVDGDPEIISALTGLPLADVIEEQERQDRARVRASDAAWAEARARRMVADAIQEERRRMGSPPLPGGDRATDPPEAA